jgi:hypothetical protein
VNSSVNEYFLTDISNVGRCNDEMINDEMMKWKEVNEFGSKFASVYFRPKSKLTVLWW